MSGVALSRRRKRGPAKSRLTDRERIFVAEYMSNGCNASQAAKDAGYKQPATMGARLLRKPHIMKIVQVQGTALLEKKELKAEDVVEQLRLVLQFNLMKGFKRGSGGHLEVTEEEFEALADVIGHCVTEVEFTEKPVLDKQGNKAGTEKKFRLKLMSKDKAMENALKYLGLVNDSTNVTNTLNLKWDDLFRPGDKQPDPIEDKILEVESRAIK